MTSEEQTGQLVSPDSEKEPNVLRDRRGNVIHTIYRSKAALKPPPANLKHNGEAARRRRQRERKEAKTQQQEG
jgi:hypothetical protein